ncbi:hypothetical protein HGRIS_000954 [Hohenbuehelia grisea]|uniref:G-protein coupled receptors family 1 profile domain-containing protein n=1 Tax=Hohenbuehelia grisea TaxID=104357 RepID=A0ABR3IQA3_9AGAR
MASNQGMTPASNMQKHGHGGKFTAQEMRTHEGLLIAFNTILVAGLLLNLIILSVACLSRKVQRTATWMLFIVSWIVLCLSYLALAGQQMGQNSMPAFGFCLAQAALMYAAPPLTAYATLIFMIQVYLSLRCYVYGEKPKEKYITGLLAIPPIIHAAIVIEVVILGLRDRNQVKRHMTGMFCSLNKTMTPIYVTLALVTVAVIGVIGLEITTALFLRRNWSAFMSMNKKEKEASFFGPGIVIRMALFSIVPIFVLIIELIIIPLHSNKMGMSVSLIMYAIVPLLAALAFGTQGDIIGALMFWKKDPISVVTRGDKEKDIA